MESSLAVVVGDGRFWKRWQLSRMLTEVQAVLIRFHGFNCFGRVVSVTPLLL